MEEGRNTYSNREITSHLGYSPEEVLKMGPSLFQQIVHPDDLKRVIEFQEKIIQAKDSEPHEIEYRVRSKSGEWKYLASRETVFSRNEDGSVKEKIGIALDITKFKENEEQKIVKIREEISGSLSETQDKLKESRERYRLATHAANTGIWDWNIVDNTVWYSERWKQMLGYTYDEIENEFSSWEGLLHPDDHDRMVNGVQKYIENPVGFFEEEFRMRCKDGSYRWIFNRADRTLDEDGRPVRMFGSHIDITERKDQQMKIEDLNESLRLINKILRHDLSNYIHLITGTLSLYRNIKDEKAIDSAEFYLKRCYDVIENMRFLESAVSAEGKLETLDVAKVLKDEARKYPIDIQVNGDCQIEMLPQSFVTIVNNIVNNAIHHGETEKMVIDIIYSGNGCVIKFRDFGKGIPDEFKDIVFKEGFSYGNSRSTGLGMFIVKKLVERAGWNIHVEDNEPKGAIFIMEKGSCSSNME